MFNFKENISLAVNGLRSNKMRALLTMLGIIIGISSVITIVTVGDSMTKSITDVFNDMGANSVQLYIIDRPDENGNTNWSRPYQAEDYISDEMIDQFLEAFGDRIACWAVSESVGPGQAINGHNKADGRIQGVNANALGINNIDIIAGHDLNEREVSGMAAMMGAGSVTTNVFIPMGVAKDMIRDTDSVTNVTDGYYAMQIKGNEKVTDSKAFTEEIDNYFNNKLYRSNKYVMVRAESMDSMIGEMTSSLDMIKLAISIIAAISLLVGGIGVILGTTLGRLGSTLLGAPGWPSVSIVLIAVGFSMGIGVFFGYYPANKAAKLDPIEALRYE